MKSTPILPYRVCSEDALSLQPWRISSGGFEEILEPELPGWDYLTQLEFSREYSVDTSVILSECGLPTGTPVELIVIAASIPGRFRRCVARSATISLDGQTANGTLEFSVDSRMLCGSLELSIELLLADSIERKKFVAHIAGSRLFSDSFVVQLEGNSSRFPMTACDFSKTFSRLRIPKAKWYLWISPSDYSVTVTQGAMLFVNSAREETITAIAGNNDDILSAISVDIARRLISFAIADEEFELDHKQYPENSVGFAICSLTMLCFPETESGQIRELLSSDPGQFDAIIQSTVV
ncbi:MAG: hypothetical protein AAGJ55_00150 [Cyanobacteria bacterium J06555_12]